MPRVSTYRGYQIYFVKKEDEDKHWFAYRPGSEYGESFDMKSTSFDEIRADIDDDADIAEMEEETR
jgi:hypothetical protein